MIAAELRALAAEFAGEFERMDGIRMDAITAAQAADFFTRLGLARMTLALAECERELQAGECSEAYARDLLTTATEILHTYRQTEGN